MSYCRFSDGDVYLFPTPDDTISCCACRLAPLVPTIYTVGEKDHPFFGTIEPCEKCNGKGCEVCMINGDTTLRTHAEAIEHLLEHRKAGHAVPEYALERLREEATEVPE